MQDLQQKKAKTFTEFLRETFSEASETIGSFFHELGVHPDFVTLMGLLGIGIGSVLLAIGRIQLGGLVILLTVPLDALDGAVARARGEIRPFGAFLDSISDRYAELFIFAGLLVYFNNLGASWELLAVFSAASGSILVSYARARAEGLGLDVKVGWFTRVERFLVLTPALLFNYPLVAVVILAIGTNFTALQRIFYVYRISKQELP